MAFVSLTRPARSRLLSDGAASLYKKNLLLAYGGDDCRDTRFV